MKWGVRKDRGSPRSRTKTKDTKKYEEKDLQDITVKKGSEIHRLVPEQWADKEASLKGHAYASYKKEDVAKYKALTQLFGAGVKYVDMTYTVTKDMTSPSTKKRIDEFVKLMDSDPDVKAKMKAATRNLMAFVPKKHFDQLDNPKSADKVYRKFSYLVVSKKELRDPYFNNLKKQGYDMVMDDGDILGGISKAPIIVFDRDKSLKLKSRDVVKTWR